MPFGYPCKAKMLPHSIFATKTKAVYLSLRRGRYTFCFGFPFLLKEKENGYAIK